MRRPVERRPALSARQHPVEAGRPLLVDVQVRLRERRDRWVDRHHGKRPNRCGRMSAF